MQTPLTHGINPVIHAGIGVDPPVYTQGERGDGAPLPIRWEKKLEDGGAESHVSIFFQITPRAPSGANRGEAGKSNEMHTPP